MKFKLNTSRKIVAAVIMGAAFMVQGAQASYASPYVVPGMQPCFNPGGCVNPNPIGPGPGVLVPPAGGGGGNGGGFGAGLVGGVVGGLVGNAIGNAINPPRTVYVQPTVQAPAYSPPATMPASYNQHVVACMQKYKSYDPASDTYMSYSGVRKPCRLP